MFSKLDGMIGLAVKARAVAFGSEASAEKVRSGKAKLVIYATDASDRTKKLIRDKCGSFNVKCFEYGSIEHLAKIMGKNKVSAIAVCDKNFADAIIRIYRGCTG